MNIIKLTVDEVKQQYPFEYFELYDSIKESGIDEQDLNFEIRDATKVNVMGGTDFINKVMSGEIHDEQRSKGDTIKLLMVWYGDDCSDDDYFENHIEINKTN